MLDADWEALGTIEEGAWAKFQRLGRFGSVDLTTDPSGRSVGVASVHGQLVVCLPRVLQRALEPPFGTADGLRTAAYATLRLLQKWGRLSGESERIANKNPDNEAPLTGLTAAFELWSDFQENGPIAVKQTVVREARAGVPDWPGTFKRTTPIIQGTEVHYGDTVARSRMRSAQAFFPRLHVAVVAEVSRLLGFPIAGVADLPRLVVAEYERAKAGVSPEFRGLRERTYSDRGRWLIERILAFWGRSLSSRAVGPQGPLSFTTSFPLLWQKLVDSSLRPRNSESCPPLPAGALSSPDDTSLGVGIKPAPDTSFVIGHDHKGPTLWIIDAKERPYSSGDSRLGSANDHYKQIIYELLRQPHGVAESRNVLVFPRASAGTHTLGCPPIHFATHCWIELQRSTVHEVALCFTCAAQAFLDGNRSWSDRQFNSLRVLLDKVSRLGQL